MEIKKKKSKSFQQFLKEVYGNDIPDKVPDIVLDNFVKRANKKSNIDLSKSIEWQQINQ